jgi:hypothetical protein
MLRKLIKRVQIFGMTRINTRLVNWKPARAVKLMMARTALNPGSDAAGRTLHRN